MVGLEGIICLFHSTQRIQFQIAFMCCQILYNYTAAIAGK